MGVLANTKQFLANKITNVAQKTADGIASSSALSPKQMLDIEKKRMEYLSAKPDMDDEEAQEFIQRNLGAVGVDVYQAYLEQLKELYKPVDLHIDSFNSNNRIRWFDIEKWVSDSEEKNLDKLVNVYQVLSEEDCNIALIYDRKMGGSLYSEDTKSDYSGALITRVHSLTNGINGEIFCSFNELTAEDLFENNVIIDLSRVGSNETKSLLMGIIVMKLQEYRLHLDKMNEKLLHVTVLEEAHNLLRKTSMGQAQESANLQGKSVEMITNSIAEMRTFGEGFIIADQAPDLLDEAVIRNTNTKIVLRLPDETDRKIVGGAMALNENQINELAKLPRGVAAVYQNDWIEAVLCKFMKYDKMQPLEYYPKDITFSLQHYFMRVFGIKDNYEMKSEDVDNVNKWLNNLKCSDKTYALLNKSLKGNVLNEEEKKTVAYNVFEGKKIALMIKGETKDNINKKVDLKIGTYIDGMDSVLIERIRNSIFEVINRFNCERRSTEMELRAEDIRRMRI